MLHILLMARSNSGRVVLEMDPDLKRELYVALATDSLTLRQWFCTQVEAYVRGKMQPSLFAKPRAESTVNKGEPSSE